MEKEAREEREKCAAGFSSLSFQPEKNGITIEFNDAERLVFSFFFLSLFSFLRERVCHHGVIDLQLLLFGETIRRVIMILFCAGRAK